MIIKPCHGCVLRTGCSQRGIFRAKAKGSGAASIRFVCPILAEKIAPGIRIEILHPFPESGFSSEEPEFIFRKLPVTAVITNANARTHTFSCVVDPGQDVGFSPDGHPEEKSRQRRFRRTAGPHRIIRFLDAEPMPRCEAGNVLRDGKCDTYEGKCMCSDSKDFHPLREPYKEQWEFPG